ncbi:MAG: HlyD family secretion protein [Planctomycetes bacterium]|nr:HlyD family secretion protein [Planctomycetota bacterium]
MPAAFAQTLRSLRTDRTIGRSALVVAAAAVLVPWAVWGVTSEVTLREVSVAGRVEVDQAATTVGTPRDGRVSSVYMVLGAQVAAGDVLVELDAEAVRIDIESANSRIASVAPRIAAIRREIDAESKADGSVDLSTTKLIEAARLRADEARVQVALSDHQATLAEDLAARNAMPKEQAREARSKADAARARVRTIEIEADTLSAGAAVDRADRATRVSKLEREIADLDATVAVEVATIRRLEHDVTEFTVRAPIGGRIGEVAAVRAGSVVELAQKLCVIVPRGTPRVVASFPLRTAGRVRPGQKVSLRFDGFDWTRFGTVAATVTTLGTPEADGTFRAELTIDTSQTSFIPLEHGLGCTAEVDVERVSPLALALRSAGRLLAGGSDEPSGTKTE